MSACSARRRCPQTYLHVSNRKAYLLHRLALTSLQEDDAKRLGHALTLEVEEHVLIDAAPSCRQLLQFRVRLVQVGSLAAVDSSSCRQVEEMLLIEAREKRRHLVYLSITTFTFYNLCNISVHCTANELEYNHNTLYFNIH